jgi:hypothetical protein
VGLELRPRRSRDAAALFAHVLTAGGPEARDAVWDHPDLLPGTADLDHPAGYLARRQAQADEHADVDAALAQIFGTGATEDGDEPPSGGGTGNESGSESGSESGTASDKETGSESGDESPER